MPILIEKESPDMYANTRIYENCYFCGKPTDTWHVATNNSVCGSCASVHHEDELPNKFKGNNSNMNKEQQQFLLDMPSLVRVEGKWKEREVWVNGRKLSLAKTLRVENISPTGFNWGYAGSGAAQLALAVLLEFVHPSKARQYYQLLKFRWVALLPQKDFQGTYNLYSIMERAFEKGVLGAFDDGPVWVSQKEYDELVADGRPDIERYKGKSEITGMAWERIKQAFREKFCTTYAPDSEWYVEDSTPEESIIEFFRQYTRPA